MSSHNFAAITSPVEENQDCQTEQKPCICILWTLDSMCMVQRRHTSKLVHSRVHMGHYIHVVDVYDQLQQQSQAMHLILHENSFSEPTVEPLHNNIMFIMCSLMVLDGLIIYDLMCYLYISKKEPQPQASMQSYIK